MYADTSLADAGWQRPREAPIKWEGNVGCDLVVGKEEGIETKIMQVLLGAVSMWWVENCPPTH